MTGEVIKMLHGAGGRYMSRFIKEHILRYLNWSSTEVSLSSLDDSSVVNNVVFTCDSYTVKPIFFPGGDIGKLAVAGTINDILMIGGMPRALSLALIIEEGFPISDLDRILESISNTAREAGVPVITGDTKVVERGSLDKIIVNTAGVGVRHPHLDHNIEVVREYRRDFNSRWLLDSNIKPGDKIIINGFIGDHAIALLSVREGFSFKVDVVSDVAPLIEPMNEVLRVGGVVAAKDPTRGGLANLLNEWVEKSNVGIRIYEERIPIRDSVRNACEYLGLDPLELGNEGKMVIAVVPDMADEVLKALRSTKLGANAEIIGEATDRFKHVVMETLLGGRRVIPPPIGDPVPRIC